MKERRPASRPEGAVQVRPTSVRAGPALSRDIQAKIGQQLRAVYDDIVDQGVPDRFVELLRNLDSDSDSGDGKKGDKDPTE